MGYPDKRCCAFVVYDEMRAVLKAVETLDGKSIPGICKYPLRAELAQPRRAWVQEAASNQSRPKWPPASVPGMSAGSGSSPSWMVGGKGQPVEMRPQGMRPHETVQSAQQMVASAQQMVQGAPQDALFRVAGQLLQTVDQLLHRAHAAGMARPGMTPRQPVMVPMIPQQRAPRQPAPCQPEMRTPGQPVVCGPRIPAQMPSRMDPRSQMSSATMRPRGEAPSGMDPRYQMPSSGVTQQSAQEPSTTARMCPGTPPKAAPPWRSGPQGEAPPPKRQRRES